MVASLIYQAASTISNDPGSSTETSTQATMARTRASEVLDLVYPEEQSKKPPEVHVGRLRDLLPAPAKRRRERIRKWAVGVTTAPRRRPTLDSCLQHLTKAGWDSPHLFMDSAVHVSEHFAHLPGTLRSPAAGAWPNHYLSLLELTFRQPDADAYLMLQDDALIYDGEDVRAYLEQALWPRGRLPIVSLYCPEPYTAKQFGWHRFRGPWVWGALALIFSRSSAQAYLRSRRICRHRWRSAEAGLYQIDVLLGSWAHQRRVPMWFPTPSLVQHIGETSTLAVACAAAGPRAASVLVGKPSDG